MTNKKDDLDVLYTHKSLDKEIDFIKEYELHFKNTFDLKFLNHKTKIWLYLSISISSIFFIMLDIFLWNIKIIVNYNSMVFNLLIFSYVFFVGYLLMRREQNLFRKSLSAINKQKYNKKSE